MKKKILICSFIALSALFSCSDDEKGSNDPGIEGTDTALLRASTSYDQLTAIDLRTAFEVLAESAQNRTTNVLVPSELPECAVMTEVTGPNDTFPKTYTIDFGDSCTHNGITRSGILVFTLDNDFYVNGSTLTISHENYTLNGYGIEGEVVYVNQSSSLFNPEWTSTITNGEVTNPDGEIFIHNGTRAVQQIGGVTTPEDWSDNIYKSVSGNHIVTKPNGANLTATILSPIIKDASCDYASEGSVTLQGETLDGVLDFGNGDCDNQATYTHSDGEVDIVDL